LKKFSRVYIEISNICNLQCDFCPEVERRKKVMSYDLFTQVIDEVQPLTEEVTFHLMGEPLTHPQFEEFLDYCETKNVPVNLTTNGTLLGHKDRQSRILKSKAIRQINFSLQSLTSNFAPAKAQEYLSGIFDFTDRALEERPDLYVNFRLWNLGSHEETRNKNQIFLEPIAERYGFTLKQDVDVAFRKSRNLRGRLHLHFDSRFDWPSLQAPVSSEKGYCYGLKSHFAIHADGTVVPCCLDKEARIALGKISQPALAVDSTQASLAADGDKSLSRPQTQPEALSILQILNSERARRLREGFDQFQVREELCRRCSFIRRFDSKFTTTSAPRQRLQAKENITAALSASDVTI
jgi:organic radical activating enzyme